MFLSIIDYRLTLGGLQDKFLPDAYWYGDMLTLDLPTRSLSSALLDGLRDQILCCRLKPGEKLAASAIGQQHGVSLSVVREALSRLVAEGWVEAQERRGFRVAPVSIPELRDITISRIEIEKIALRQSITLGGAEWEEKIRLTYKNLSDVPRASPGDPGPLFATWTDLHQKFHAALLSACPAGWLLRFRELLFQKCERYRFLSYSLVSRDVENEHRRIFETTLDRDIDAAIAALSDHYTATAEIIIEGLSDIRADNQTAPEGDVRTEA